MNSFRAISPLAIRLAVVFLVMLVAQGLGSVFNIWYNLRRHIRPLLTGAQLARFQNTISIFNGVAYPVLLAVWGVAVFSLLRKPLEAETNRRRVINLPWVATGIGGLGWVICVPALLLALRAGGEPLDPTIYFHLPVSVAIGALIALTLGFLAIDLLSQALLYPFYFTGQSPWNTPGAYSLSIAGRGVFWTLSAGLCPIVALLLLIVSPSPDRPGDASFALAVAGICVAFGLIEAWLLGRLVIAPIEELRRASRQVQQGDLSARVRFLRADEFGVLGHEFNSMVLGLLEKETIQERFGRYVGTEVAKELLTREEELGGVEREITVLFSDIRGYTSFCERVTPDLAVAVLNHYHACMTETIERHGGIVTQIMGDGFLATFGATGRGAGHHADQAISAGREMLERMPGLNHRLAAIGIEPIRIGVGMHTGPAVVGTIGSPRRMEYTVVGATVNVASRIESLTKPLATPLLFSAATLASARETPRVIQLPPQQIRGKDDPIQLYTLESLPRRHDPPPPQASPADSRDAQPSWPGQLRQEPHQLLAAHRRRSASGTRNAPATPPAEGVRVTYLGTNGYLLQSAGASVMIDPYLSRYPISRVALNLRNPTHEKRLAEALAQAHAPARIDAFVVTHGHFDHLMDVPDLQRRLGGVVIASPSSCNLAQGAGVAPENLLPSLPGDVRQAGKVRVRILAATHDLLFGKVPFPGDQAEVPAEKPARPSRWVCGPPLAFVIEMGGRRIYVESGGTRALLPAPEATGVDLAILGVSLPDSRARYVDAVTKMKPRYVLPSHQDNFFLPLEQGFRFAGVSDFESVLESHRAAGLDATSRMILMDFFRPWTLR